MILLTKLLLSLVTFVPLYPCAQDSTPSQFSHYNLQSTHSDTLFLETYLLSGTKFHLKFYH